MSYCKNDHSQVSHFILLVPVSREGTLRDIKMKLKIEDRLTLVAKSLSGDAKRRVVSLIGFALMDLATEQVSFEMQKVEKMQCSLFTHTVRSRPEL